MRKEGVFLTLGMIVYLITGVIAFNATSTNYEVWSKPDFGSASNATSTSFINRFIFGNQPVSQVSSTTYSGRLGVLNVITLSAIDILYPTINLEVSRGSDSVPNEDDLGLVSNMLNLRTKVYVNSSNAEIPDINVSFYWNGTFLSANLTNASGNAVYSYDKSSKSAGIHNITANYSTNDYDYSIYNSSTMNFSIVTYSVPNSAGNKGVATQYVNGQTAILYFNITKTNSSGTFFYGPQNITINATTSAGIHYSDTEYVSGYRSYNTTAGKYQSQVAVNKTRGAYIKWNIYVSNDNYDSFIATALQADVEIVDGPICGNGLIESGETCDDGNIAGGDGCSSVCTTEVSGGGGGGGGGVTPPKCTNDCISGEEKVCVTKKTLRTRTCGNYDDDSCLEFGGAAYIDCGEGFICQDSRCIPVICDQYWSCEPWSNCFYDNLENYLNPTRLSANLGKVNNEFNELVLDRKTINVSLMRNSLSNPFKDTIDQIKRLFETTGKVTEKDSCNSREDLGDKKCYPARENKYQECNSKIRSGRENFYWKTINCPSGLVCGGKGECGCSGKNSCEAEEKTKCYGSKKIQTCEADKNGCLKWGKAVTGPKGMICSGGEWVCSNTNSCEAEDEKICTSSARYKICQKDSNGCLKLSANQKCEKGEICSKGECIIKNCLDGIKNFDEEGIDCGGSCSECIKIPLCGDGKIESGETCDDKNTAGGDGCSSICLIESNWTCAEEPSVCIKNLEESKESSINATVEDVGAVDRYFVKSGESFNININKGDDISITYESIKENIVSLLTKKIETQKSNISIQESHTVKVNQIGEGKIIVTVTSEPITKEINLGETAIFNLFSEVSGSPPLDGGSSRSREDSILPSTTDGADYIQKRGCVNTLCNLPLLREARLCQIDCEEKWDCKWTVCIPEEDIYSYSYECQDENECKTEYDKQEKILCGQQPFNYTECSGVWSCAKWSECNADYNIKDVLEGKIAKKGHQLRECYDKLAKCDLEITERRSCELKIPVKVQKTQWCNEDYVEIFEISNGGLVSRIKESEIAEYSELKRIDISLITTEFSGYCDYCFDGLKNYDETEVDCGGPNCPECILKFSFFDWLFWLIIILWTLFGFILVIIFWKKRKEEEKKREVIKKQSRIKRFFAGLMPSRKEERIREKKIENWFKRLFRKEKIEEVQKHKKGIIKEFFENYKRKREVRKRGREHRRIAREFKKKIKKKQKEIKMAVKAEKRKKRKEGKRKIREIKGEIRKRKIINLMRKLRLWRRQGYYGTAELETELKKLKSQRE